MICIKDFVPESLKDLRVVVLGEIELSTKRCHLFEHGVFLGIKNERKLICEFHIPNLHENAHHWGNSGQFGNWEAAAKNPAGNFTYASGFYHGPKSLATHGSHITNHLVHCLTVKFISKLTDRVSHGKMFQVFP